MAGRTIATRNAALLREARHADLDAIDALTVECYAPIQASYVAMLGDECYETVRQQPELSWQERKIAQNRDLYERHADQVWVVDEAGGVIAFVTFWLFPGQGYGHIDNNGVHPSRTREGWATFMYRHVLEHFRRLGLRFAHVDTGLDDAHIAARRAYEAVGFDRTVPLVEYWQDLGARNPGSVLDA